MAIKGGIARKILKHLYGTPEPPGTFDIDCLVLMPEEAFELNSSDQAGQAESGQPGLGCTSDDDGAMKKSSGTAAQAAHEAVTGLELGALKLEAQDVEVIPKVK